LHFWSLPWCWRNFGWTRRRDLPCMRCPWRVVEFTTAVYGSCKHSTCGLKSCKNAIGWWFNSRILMNKHWGTKPIRFLGCVINHIMILNHQVWKLFTLKMDGLMPWREIFLAPSPYHFRTNPVAACCCYQSESTKQIKNVIHRLFTGLLRTLWPSILGSSIAKGFFTGTHVQFTIWSMMSMPL
jgi:hypothetical protein